MTASISRGVPPVDLHVHSSRSDGTLSPRQLVDYAMEKGLKAFALTDHDTTEGLDEAVSYAQSLRERPCCQDGSLAPKDACPDSVPEVIPGIEFSTEYEGQDIHVVGLYIDYKNEAFGQKLQAFVDSRILRNQKMCSLLQQAGIQISYEKLLLEFPGAVITRAHYARYLLSHGYVKSIKEAFERYVGDDCPYFVPREKVTPFQAVELILKADGIPILAHPGLYSMSDSRLEKLIKELKEAGLLGIEAIYSTYDGAMERKIRALASKYRLLISGGSDFHGANKPGLDLGCGYSSLYIPKTVLCAIKECRKNLLFTDLDGTLLLDDSTVSPAMKEALFGMTKKGHRLILTTGRPLPSVLSVCSQLGFLKDGVPLIPNLLVISYNGALVYDCSKKTPVLEHRISQEDIAFITKKAGEAGLHIHGYTDSEILCRFQEDGQENEELRYYRRRIAMPVKWVPDVAQALPYGTWKLQVIHLTDNEALKQFRDSLLPCFEGRLQMIFSNPRYLEILPAQAGKGNALRHVCAYLPAPLSHTFAAGDEENDVSMLLAAQTGIAMKNAVPQAKKAARVITQADNNHDGLLEILNRYFQ